MRWVSGGCVVIVVAAVLGAPAAWRGAAAQTNPWDIPKPGTYEGSVELQRRQQEQQRQSQPGAPPTDPTAPRSAPGGNASGDSSRAAYESWDKRPALPPDRNQLLGRWSWTSAAAANQGLGSLFDGSVANAMGCIALFGDGAVEFQPDTIVNIQQGRATQVGTVAYRGGGRQVVALQRDGARLFLMFDFVAPDRISLSGVPCVMSRVAPASGGRTAAAAPGAAKPATARAEGFEVLGVVLGRSNDRAVRDNIAARGARPLIGNVPGTQELRIQVHDRKYGHPLLANVWYDFDNGVLSSVTIIWERDKAAGPALFQQRSAFLAQALGVGPPQQAAKLAGRAKGVDVVLVDDAAAGMVTETYSVPR